jgi:hypothetical protein
MKTEIIKDAVEVEIHCVTLLTTQSNALKLMKALSECHIIKYEFDANHEPRKIIDKCKVNLKTLGAVRLGPIDDPFTTSGTATEILGGKLAKRGNQLTGRNGQLLLTDGSEGK